jgi:hypothetical protein
LTLTIATDYLTLTHIPLYYTVAWVNGIIIEAMDCIIDIAGMIPFGSVSVENAGKSIFIAYYTSAAYVRCSFAIAAGL